MENQQRPSRKHHKPSNSISSISTTSTPLYPLRRSASFENAPTTTTNLSKSVVTPESTSRRPSASHSRSNSNSIIREGIGNLNRWSASTASSAATHTRSKSSSFSRRISLSSPSRGPTTPSPRKKLQKQENSNFERASPHSPKNTVASISTTTPQLPPIVALPSLQQAVDSSPSSILISAASERTSDYFTTQRTPPRFRSTSTTDPPGRVPESPSARRRRQEDGGSRRGHTRQRSQASSAGTFSSEQSRDRSSRQPSQKAMLSKALQKANTAVLLDNAQNFEGAIQAYSEACSLLQQVMQRSSGEDDKRKLEAIRSTYTSRIEELQKIAPQPQEDGKALPARPQSSDYREELFSSITDGQDRSRLSQQGQKVSAQQSQLLTRRESLLPSAFEPGHYRSRTNSTDKYNEQRSFSKSPIRDRVVETSINLAPPMERQYMPPPLSPRRPISPTPRDYANSGYVSNSASLPTPRDSGSSTQGHARAASNESMSWLDTIDESGGSTASSLHSRTSSGGIRRKHLRTASTATEAEFDNALDEAIEAAYDDVFEPMGDSRPLATYDDNNQDDDVIASVRRKIALAKERVRQTERDQEVAFARDRERIRRTQVDKEKHDSIDDYEDGNDSEEEERMLEEMTRGYIMDDFEFGLQSKSALPRESDSSGFSGRTWNSSIGSVPTTAGTSLTTVTETSAIPKLPTLRSRTPPLMHPPPIQALPPPPNPYLVPTLLPPTPPTTAGNQSVRSRRLSGQNPKQLMIETTPNLSPPAAPSGPPQANVPPAPKTAGMLSQGRDSTMGRPLVPMSATVRKSSSPLPAAYESAPPPAPSNQSFDGESSKLPRSGSPNRSSSRPGIRKNFSSSSLKNLKSRNLSVSGIDDGSEVSPHTPNSQGFATSRETGRIPTMPALPTPIANSFREKINGQASGGLYLFDSNIHSPESPGSPNPLAASAPIPLEPCPSDHLLRPFWLMRALYQTIAHPRGGYLSTKLFVPRDVWRVKGVKIKNLEDKISNCDYLTAALLNLAKVDTFDADAVLDEMQSFETVLEQVQANLSKKLGNEVGVNGSSGLFKDAPLSGDLDGNSLGPKSAGPSKSAFSWKRLRSKNSNATLTSGYSGKTTPSDGGREPLTMSTIPMTSLATVRFAKRDVSQIQLVGPHANYMGALARLFDAAQVIDQIARQVEDPGLKHLNSTYVGLELCTRHAAEFFGFYICRFVLTDISLLLDKFIKRGSEWVIQ